MKSDAENHRELVSRVLPSDGAAAERFFALAGDTILRSCFAGTGDWTLARQLIDEVRASLGENDFRWLQSYDGREPVLDSVAFAVRKILRSRLVRRLSQGMAPGWQFQILFGDEIKRKIARKIRDDEERIEVFDYVTERLIADDCRNLRKYAGGIFAAFLNTTVQNLISDFGRQTHKEGRLRYPEAIKRLSQIDRLVFREIYWNGSPPVADVLLTKVGARAGPNVSTSVISEAIDRVREVLPPGYPPRHKTVVVPLPDGKTDGKELPDPNRRPDEALQAKEMAKLEKAAFEVLIPAIRQLPFDDLVLVIRELFRNKEDPEREKQDREDLIRRLPKEVQESLEQVEWGGRGRPPIARLEKIFAKLRPLLAREAVEKWLRAVREG